MGGEAMIWMIGPGLPNWRLVLVLSVVWLTPGCDGPDPGLPPPEAPGAHGPATPPTPTDPTVSLGREVHRLEVLHHRVEAVQRLSERMEPRVEQLRRASRASAGRWRVLDTIHLSLGAEENEKIGLLEAVGDHYRYALVLSAPSTEGAEKFADALQKSLGCRDVRTLIREDLGRQRFSIDLMFPTPRLPGGPAQKAPPSAVHTPPEVKQLELEILRLRTLFEGPRHMNRECARQAFGRERPAESDLTPERIMRYWRCYQGYLQTTETELNYKHRPPEPEAGAMLTQAGLRRLARPHLRNLTVEPTELRRHLHLHVRSFELRASGDLQGVAETAQALDDAGALLGGLRLERPDVDSPFKVHLHVHVLGR